MTAPAEPIFSPQTARPDEWFIDIRAAKLQSNFPDDPAKGLVTWLFGG